MLRDKVFAANASSPPVTINTAWAWGDGGAGRLGDNSLVDKSSPVSIAGGFTDWVCLSYPNSADGSWSGAIRSTVT